MFPEHLPLSEIQKGLKSGRFLQGSFMASRENFLEGFVSVQDQEEQVFIFRRMLSQPLLNVRFPQVFVRGREHLNRAVHQDIVAVELLPRAQWSAPSSLVLEDEKVDDSQLAQDGDEDEQLMTSASGPKQPTGRVVGIIKRNWRQYCGMLQKSVLKGVSTRPFFTVY